MLKTTTHTIALLLCIFYFFLMYSQTFAQDIASLLNAEKKLKLSGGIQLEQIFYNSDAASIREPYNFFLQAQASLSFMQWSIPFQMSYTNQNFNYNVSIPFRFNQLSMQPTYRWIKAYLGYTTLQYSPYTLAGHPFVGGAIELTPKGHWSFATLYGRFQQASAPNSNTDNNPYYYERWGHGAKISYQFDKRIIESNKTMIESRFDKDGNIKADDPNLTNDSLPPKKLKGYITLLYFKAQDLSNSVKVPDSVGIKPQANFSSSIDWQLKWGEHWQVQQSISWSVLTENTLLPDTLKSMEAPLLRLLVPVNASTRQYNALKSQLQYQTSLFSLTFFHDWVAPEYRTLGGYYFNNDLENIGVQVSTQFQKGKIQIQLSVGKQRNNLNQTKLSTQEQFSWAGSCMWQVSKQLRVQLNYSDFQNIHRVRSVFERINQVGNVINLDTLNFTQIARSYQSNLSWQFKETKKAQQSLNLNFSYQLAAQTQEGIQLGAIGLREGSRFYNINTSYQRQWTKPAMTCNLSFNYNQNEQNNGTNATTWGPTITLQKKLLNDLLSSQCNFSWNESYLNMQMTARILVFRASLQALFQEKHQCQASLVWQQRNLVNNNSFQDITFSLSYQRNF